MSVNGVSHILDGKALAHGHSDLMNQVCDVRTHHVRTQDLVRLLIRNYLDIAHVLPNGHGLAGRPQTEGTRHGFEALFACLALGKANTGYLRHGIDLSLIHISEPTRLRRISYAVFCLKKKKKKIIKKK